VEDVSANAFKAAYDFYNKNAVGDPKTRKQYLVMLRGELAEYQDNEDGSKDITRGLLKNFTDENYKHALNVGQKEVSATLQQLHSFKYPNFEAFRIAREKAETTLRAHLSKNNVAYGELSERLLHGLEELSIKIGLEFKLSDTEKETERAFLADRRKTLEQQKKKAELDEALMNLQQVQRNLETEKRLLAEQTEKLAREWKAKIDLDSKLRTEQIARELNDGFDERAKALQKELTDINHQTLAMMRQIQRESREHQAQFTQALRERRKKESSPTSSPPQPHQPSLAERGNQPGLLGSLLSPVTHLVGNLLTPGGRPLL
jgi:hypothetical protein